MKNYEKSWIIYIVKCRKCSIMKGILAENARRKLDEENIYKKYFDASYDYNVT